MEEPFCAFVGRSRQLDRSLIVQDGKPCVFDEGPAGIGKVGDLLSVSRERLETHRSSISVICLLKPDCVMCSFSAARV
jgi:hypothetical protein